jgi:hypothetical protein
VVGFSMQVLYLQFPLVENLGEPLSQSRHYRERERERERERAMIHWL